MMTTQRWRALKRALDLGRQHQAKYMHDRRKHAIEHGKDPDYVPAMLQRLNDALEAFTGMRSEEEYETMLRALWLYSIHNWASSPGDGTRWGVYVAGLLSENML